MNNQTGDTIVESVFYGLSYFGALFHWMVFFGRKSFNKVLEYNVLNTFIGIIVLAFIILFFKNEVLKLIVYFINNRLNHN